MVKHRGTRRGSAGDDVTETEQFQTDVVAERDESFVVEDTDSDHTIETESTVITDDHEVVTSTEVGSEEDFVAESEEGDAETIDEDGRQGRRKGLRRRGSRKGSEYDLIDNIISVAEREYGDLEDLTRTQADKVCETVAGITGESVENVKAQLRDMDELNGVTRQGSRRGGDAEDHVEDLEEELEDVEEEIEDVEDSEDEEREGRRKGLRRRGSRRGESVIMDEDGTTEEVDLPEPDEREGRRKGSRMGAYGGKSPEHQSSIKAAVSVAMSDRRL